MSVYLFFHIRKNWDFCFSFQIHWAISKTVNFTQFILVFYIIYLFFLKMSCSIFNAINTIFCFLSITLTSTLLFKLFLSRQTWTLSLLTSCTSDSPYAGNTLFFHQVFLPIHNTGMCALNVFPDCIVLLSSFMALFLSIKSIVFDFSILYRVLFLRRKPSIKEICLTWFIRLPVQHGISLLLKGVCFHTIWLQITG